MTTISRAAVDRAIRAGMRAARDGRDAAECPYSPAGDDEEERILARYWIRGYARQAPIPADAEADG